MAGERTEAPTPKRLRDARQKGDVAHSDEVVSIGVLLLAVLAMKLLGPALWDSLAAILAQGLGQPVPELTRESAQQLARDTAWQTVRALLPLLGLVAVSAVALNVAQVGPLFTGQRLKPQLSRINPGAGLKRIVSVDGLFRLAKSLLKFVIIAVVVGLTLRAQFADLAGLGALSIGAATARLASLGFDIAFRAAGVLFLLALADYAWQRRQHLKRLRMTKHEVKQELKETDGDPHIKAAIRRRRQQLLNRMIAAVKTADVVVTNPTHYAVALKYDAVSMPAPMVVAKGQDYLALRIREVAREAGVPVLEEPPLARALHASVQVGHYIPASLFHAVAEVLAWVYALRARAGRRTTAPGAAR
ncbi:MAG: flagellar biosynthesis protein FlhB [Tepidiforma sp.]|nr:flagellar biosynthesis protein FlhB [Tepidiforma sp.]GIW18344.1 MAG: flagellar biosynthesis protein FlhB [Tepidiforma sp.]